MQSELALVTTASDIASRQMETLVNRLSTDLKADTFEAPTRDIMLEMCLMSNPWQWK